MSPRSVVPPVWLGPGAITDPRALARFVDLVGVPLPVGPVTAGSRRTRTGGTVVHGAGVGGLEHEDAHGVSVDSAVELLSWASARGLSACLAVRGRSPGDLAAVVGQVCRSVEGDAVVGVEVDLRGTEEQAVIKAMARVREAAPRGVLLLARLGALDPALVPCARSAVAGGAHAVVVAGQVPLGAGRWWSGPSTAAVTRSALRLLRQAAAEQRWPGAPLVAAGGIHDPTTARQAVHDGATAVQLGTALWADPTLLDPVRRAVLGTRERPPSPRPPTSPPDDPWR
ncbi:hypothetical protein [Ornithinimicrobium sp. LYQ103]|uniref:hypothetical protein n=1 Tax=Ornithinimicrobium sp. LYQ103 TaxID=3378796 RepID=UPI003851BE7E